MRKEVSFPCSVECHLELCGSKNFISVPGFLEQKNLGSVSVIFKKEEQYKCMNSFMCVSSIFTKQMNLCLCKFV